MTDVLWQTVLGEVEVTVSRASFATWFKNTQLLRNNGDHLVVGVPNIFTKRQLEQKFNDLIVDILEKNGLDIKKITYKIQSPTETSKTQESPTKQDSKLNTKTKPTTKTTTKTKQPAHNSLNRRYTFHNFVVGSSNELAYAACQAIARSPGSKYNPLFIYGGVGLGKTHLIQAVGNEIIKKHPKMRVEYVTSENFTSEFVASILKNKNFTQKYRGTDVLIVDDMQFIAGKEKTQEEFFHTFNALHQANKQIIISSDRPPKAIATLEERLQSRFEQGMTADIGAPDYETRAAIIQSKAGGEYDIELSEQVVEYLATNIQNNIRELEGALTKIFANCEMRNCEPSLAIVKDIIHPDTKKQKRLTAQQIVDKTAEFFELTEEEITGPKRTKNIVEPRQIAMYLMRSELHLSFPQIAKSVGRKDHTTAMHSVDKIENAMNKNHQIRDHVLKLKEEIYA